MIDDLTIAANGRLEGSRFDRRAASGAAESALSGVFGELLHGSASISAGKSSAVSTTTGPDEKRPKPEYRGSVAREATDGRDDGADRGLRNDGDPVSTAGREEIPPDSHDDDPVHAHDPHRATEGRDETEDAASDREPGSIGDTPAVVDAQASPGDHSGSQHGNATAANLGARTAILAETPDIAARTETLAPVGEGLLKAGPVDPQRPTGLNSASAAQSTEPEMAIAIAQRQAGGLAKVVGHGGRTQVSVIVAKEAETLVSQPLHTLAAAAATEKESVGSKTGRNANGGQANSGFTGSLHPTTPPTQVQPAGAQQTPSQPSAWAGAAPTSVPSSTIPANTAGPPVLTSETTVGDPTGLGGSPIVQRGAGLSVTQASEPNKPASQHHSVVDQISVNITKAVKADMDKIEIRLRPERLGRVEVSLEVTRDGRVVAAVTADSRGTLELLKADARGLEKALQDAGLKADSGSLSFSLRGHDTAGRQGSGSDPNVPSIATNGDSAMDGEVPPVSLLPANRQGGIMADGRIDIRA